MRGAQTGRASTSANFTRTPVRSPRCRAARAHPRGDERQHAVVILQADFEHAATVNRWMRGVTSPARDRRRHDHRDADRPPRAPSCVRQRPDRARYRSRPAPESCELPSTQSSLRRSRPRTRPLDRYRAERRLQFRVLREQRLRFDVRRGACDPGTRRTLFDQLPANAPGPAGRRERGMRCEAQQAVAQLTFEAVHHRRIVISAATPSARPRASTPS